MAKIIAFAGKGGVGKTTVAAMLVRYIIEELKNTPVFVVDADPNSNLNELLGVAVGITIGEAREQMKTDVPKGMTKDVWIEYKVNEAVIEGEGFDLLVMGRPEGPGCYCAANSITKKSIDAIKGHYPFVVVDNEAGMEHMSRLVTQDVDCLYVISDGAPRGIKTAQRILDLIGELKLNIVKTCLVINRLKPAEEENLNVIISGNGLEITGTIRDDDTVWKNDGEGGTVFTLDKDTGALADAYGIFRRTVK